MNLNLRCGCCYGPGKTLNAKPPLVPALSAVAAPAPARIARKKDAEQGSPLIRLQRIADAACDSYKRPVVESSLGCQRAVNLLTTTYEACESIYYTKGGYLISQREQRLIDATGGGATYGEVQPEGIAALLENIASSAGPGSSFLDIGSGIGRVVLQLALTAPEGTFDQIIGVELSASRHEQAEHVLQQLQEQLQLQHPTTSQTTSQTTSRLGTNSSSTHCSSNCNLNGNHPQSSNDATSTSDGGINRRSTVALGASDHDATATSSTLAGSQLGRVLLELDDATTSPWLQQATHVFMANTAFGAVGCRQVVDQLAKSKRCKVLITTRELPFQPHFALIGYFGCEVSWSAAGRAFVYVPLPLERAHPALLARFMTHDGVAWLSTHRVPVCAPEPLGGWPMRLAPFTAPATGANAAAP